MQPPEMDTSLEPAIRQPEGYTIRRAPVSYGAVCDWTAWQGARLGLRERVDEAEQAMQKAAHKKTVNVGDKMRSIRQAETDTVTITRSEIMRVLSDQDARLELLNILFERSDGLGLTLDDAYRIAASEVFEACFFLHEESEPLTALLQGYAPNLASVLNEGV